jgi:hypothetical protein
VRCCWSSQAELALARGDPALAMDITDRLIASAPGMSPGRVITFLWKLKGQALNAMGHTEEAQTLLRAAIILLKLFEVSQLTEEMVLIQVEVVGLQAAQALLDQRHGAIVRVIVTL